MKFGDLKTGDVMELAGTKAVVMAIERPHPWSPGFWLFVWYIFEQKRVSVDMLSPTVELIPGSSVYQDGLYSFGRANQELTRGKA
jgi:hypothetical protein